MKKISRIKVPLDQLQLKYLERSFRNGELVKGAALEKFEKELCRIFKKKYCILTSNGFSALFLSILSSGIKNKNILMPAVSTCFSIANAIKASGNVPVYADVEKASGNIDYKSASAIFQKNKFDLIISPNHFGILSDVKKLRTLAPVIEDCAQSFISNMAPASAANIQVSSFYPTKIVNAIDGGAVFTNNKKLADFIENRVYYEDQYKEDNITRFNFRLPNIHASVGLASLQKIKAMKRRYSEVVAAYSAVLRTSKHVYFLGSDAAHNGNTLQKLNVVFRNEEKKTMFMNDMTEKGIPCVQELLPMTPGINQYKNAAHLLKCSCSLPLYADLSPEEINYICRSLQMVLNR